MAARPKPSPTWEAYEFTITIEEDIIRCKPIECFHVSELNIIMYQLALNADIEVTIPYYVSNGHMNEVRANMLFPFMNFSIKEDDNPTCPTSYAPHLVNHGLLKYGIIENMNKKLDDDLKQSSGLSEEQYNKLSINGVRSIFSRWSNILDFIIGCCTPMIINFDVSNIKCYFPQASPDEYNPLSCKEYYYIPETNTYRIKLLEKIKEFQVELFEKLHIKITPHRLPIKEQTVYEFNAMLNICHTKYQFQLSRYRNISDKLSEFAAPLFPDYIIPNTVSLHTDLLQLNMKKWRATCTPTTMPHSYIVSNDIQLEPIPNLKKYIVDDITSSTIESHVTSIPHSELNTTLSGLLPRIKHFSCKQGLSKKKALQIRDEILSYKAEHPQEPIFLYVYWSFVVSLFSEEILRIYSDPSISYVQFLVGGEERYIWLKDFFSSLHDAGVTITIFSFYKQTKDMIETYFGSFIKSVPINVANKNNIINQTILNNINKFLGRKKTRKTNTKKQTRQKIKRCNCKNGRCSVRRCSVRRCSVRRCSVRRHKRL